MPEAKGRSRRRALAAIIVTAALLGCLGLTACGGKPEPTPTQAPAPTAEPTGAPEPTEIDIPVNAETPEDPEDTLEALAVEDGVLTPDGEGGYNLVGGDGTVSLTVTDPAEVQEALNALPPSLESETPSVINGDIGGTSYIAVINGNVTVYITLGDKTLKAETKGTDTAAVNEAASVAASVVNASRVKEAYARGRDDYDHNKAAYYMELADCLVFYPAQLSKITAYEDQSVIFTDTRSSVNCSVRLEHNPYRDIDELISLMNNSPNNTVLAYGDNWLTSEYIRDGMVTFSYMGLGKKYMVTEELCYPRNYSFVFDELRELMAVRFLEGSKWVDGNRPPRKAPASYGLRDYFYPEYGLFLTLPDTLKEQEDANGRIVYRDDVRNSGVTVTLFELPEEDRNDIFRAFYVVARDGDVTLGKNWVRWHNSYGMFIGATSGSAAALVRFEGGDAYSVYKSIYGELCCMLAKQHYEPLPPRPDDVTVRPTEPPQPSETPRPSEVPQPTETPRPTQTPRPTATPSPTATPQPAPRPTEPPVRPTPNVIDDVVDDKKIVYPPAPVTGNDPLEYYSDADWRAVNTSLDDFVDMEYHDEVTILSVILQVLRCNGYTEAEWTDAVELSYDLMYTFNDIDDALFELDLYGTDFRMTGDLFPYVCKALEMDQIPEYRLRPESDPPAPEWLEEMRRSDDFREEDVDWDEVRRILDEGESPEDYWDLLWSGEWDPFAYPGPWTDEGDPYEDEEPWPGEGGYSGDEEPWPDEGGYSGDEEPWPDEGGYSEFEEGGIYIEDENGWRYWPPHYEPGIFADMSFSWPEYGITFSEEYLEAVGQLMDTYYTSIIDHAEYCEGNGSYPDEYYRYGDYILLGYPTFYSVGKCDIHWIGAEGVYSTWSEYSDEALYAAGSLVYMDISEEGLWVQYDPYTGEILDYGLLIWSDQLHEYGMTCWYSVTKDGEFFSVWSFWCGAFMSTKHGPMIHHWEEGQWEEFNAYWDYMYESEDWKYNYGETPLPDDLTH